MPLHYPPPPPQQEGEYDDLDWEDEDDDDSNDPAAVVRPASSSDQFVDHLEAEFTNDINNMQAELQGLQGGRRQSMQEGRQNSHISYQSQEMEDDSEFWAIEDASLHNLNESWSARDEPDQDLIGGSSNQEVFIDVSHRDLQESSNSNYYRDAPLMGSGNYQQQQQQRAPEEEFEFEDDDAEEFAEEDSFVSDHETSSDTITSDRLYDSREVLPEWNNNPEHPQNDNDWREQAQPRSSTNRMNESSGRSKSSSFFGGGNRASQRSNGGSTAKSTEDQMEEDPLLIVDKTPNMMPEQQEQDTNRMIEVDDVVNPNQRKSIKAGNAWWIGMMAICCCCILLAVAIVLPIYFLVIKDNNTNKDNNTDKPSPTSAPTGYIIPLQKYTRDAMEANALSPQQQAYDWLLADPHLDDYSEDRKLQRFALVTLYYGLRGDNWTTSDNQNWLDYNVSECMWGFRGANQSGFHTKCEQASTQAPESSSSNIFNQNLRHRTLQAANEDLILIEIKLPSNNLVGSLPPEIQQLSQLKSLDLGHNTIFGKLPYQMSSLRNMLKLNMTDNRLWGTIPWIVSPLEQIDFSRNGFNVSLPSWFTSLKTLQRLDLSYNQFTGTIMANTMNWGESLQSLQLQFNRLTGRVPNQVGFLSNLEMMELDHNQLNGTLPTQIGAMTQLQEMALYNNHLTGAIPSQIGQMKPLKMLQLVGNHFTEAIPSQVGLLTNLQSLWLYDNALSGTIPRQVGNLADHSLQHVILYDNQLMGVVPNKLCGIEELQFDCGPNLCGCNCTCSYDVNATNAEPNSNVTDEFSIGSAEGQSVGNGTTAEIEDARYGINPPYYGWGQDNKIQISYPLSDYIEDDSIKVVVYDGIACREGAKDITEESNEFFVLDGTAPADEKDEALGTKQFLLDIALNNNITASAPFYTEWVPGMGQLEFCIGLLINYNQMEEEVNAIEIVLTLELNSSDSLVVDDFTARTVIAPRYTIAFLSGDNPCRGKQPDLPDTECEMDGVAVVAEQSPVNVTVGYQGLKNTSAEPLTSPFVVAGLCPVNVNWRLGAEHYSLGEYDETGTGPVPLADSPDTPNAFRLGYQCQHFDNTNTIFTKEYNWTHCSEMQVGQTYEIQWSHSTAGACGTPYQFQTPYGDGLFCTDNVLTDFDIGMQAQVFTVVNDEQYYYPDLINGMITLGAWGSDITIYTGSATGMSRDNSICSQLSPITWHVDRECHLISASSFDKLCSDMKAQAVDMSADLKPHGARELVMDSLAANKHMN